jgi:hypothetical protein
VIELEETRLGADWDFEGGRVKAGSESFQTEDAAGFFVRLKARRGVIDGVKPHAARRLRLRKWLDSIKGVVINRPRTDRPLDPAQQPALLAQAGFTVPDVAHRHVPGQDVRVHTVADQAFATEIGSSGVDHRFSAETGTYRARALPESLAELCCRTAARERLWLAGFDFRVNAAGEWICVGMDVQPDFVSCERYTGQPIADKMLDLFDTHFWHVSNTRAPNVTRSDMLWRSVSVESVVNVNRPSRKPDLLQIGVPHIDVWSPAGAPAW